MDRRRGAKWGTDKKGTILINTRGEERGWRRQRDGNARGGKESMSRVKI